MADNITIKDGNAVNRVVTAREKTALNIWTQRFLPQFLGIGSDETDVSKTNPLPVQEMAISTFRRVTTAGTNAVNVKASAGSLITVHITNFTDVLIYVKFHNTAGTPTAGSGVVFVVGCQAGMIRDVYVGRDFATGIGMTVVAGAPDANNAAVLADAVVEVGYV